MTESAGLDGFDGLNGFDGFDGCILPNGIDVVELMGGLAAFEAAQRKKVRAGTPGSEEDYDAFMTKACERLGLTAAKARYEVHLRNPLRMGSREIHRGGQLRIATPLEFSLLCEDVLHVTYAQLAPLGCGRRLLTAGILRAVLSGMCDVCDESGRAGDFPPRDALTDDAAERIVQVQKRCLAALDEGLCRKLRVSLEQRLRNVSTTALLLLYNGRSRIRTYCRTSASNDFQRGPLGLDAAMRTLKRYLKVRRRTASDKLTLEKIVRKENKAKTAKNGRNGKDGGRRLKKPQLRRRKNETTRDALRRTQIALAAELDPARICWNRRPSDPDWYEGKSSRKRRPVLPRLAPLDGRGLDGLPGLTEPVDAEQWSSIRTDWTVTEARQASKASGAEAKASETPAQQETRESLQERPEDGRAEP